MKAAKRALNNFKVAIKLNNKKTQELMIQCRKLKIENKNLCLQHLWQLIDFSKSKVHNLGEFALVQAEISCKSLKTQVFPQILNKSFIFSKKTGRYHHI